MALIDDILLKTTIREGFKKLDRFDRVDFTVDLIDRVENKLIRKLGHEERDLLISEIYDRFDYYMDIYPESSVDSLIRFLNGNGD